MQSSQVAGVQTHFETPISLDMTLKSRSQTSKVIVRPVGQLVERRTPNLLPVRARVRDASALDI